MMREWYDDAQICLNAHVITDMAISYPNFRKDFCPDCGAATITECQKCRAPIQGRYQVPGVTSVGAGVSEARAYCHACGTAYPWTATRLDAAKELAREAEDLNDEERELLARSLDDIVADTPRTQLAAGRVKRLLAKAGKGTRESMRELLVNIASEVAKKAMFGA